MFTYDPSKIKERGKDQMRFEIGDTQTEGGKDTCALCDEEYDAIIGAEGQSGQTWLKAKLAVLEAVMFKMSYQVDTKIDVLSYSFGERAQRWAALYEKTKKELAASSSLPAMSAQAQRKPPYFYTGMQRNPYKGWL